MHVSCEWMKARYACFKLWKKKSFFLTWGMKIPSQPWTCNMEMKISTNPRRISDFDFQACPKVGWKCNFSQLKSSFPNSTYKIESWKLKQAMGKLKYALSNLQKWAEICISSYQWRSENYMPKLKKICILALNDIAEKWIPKEARKSWKLNV